MAARTQGRDKAGRFASGRSTPPTAADYTNTAYKPAEAVTAARTVSDAYAAYQRIAQTEQPPTVEWASDWAWDALDQTYEEDWAAAGFLQALNDGAEPPADSTDLFRDFLAREWHEGDPADRPAIEFLWREYHRALNNGVSDEALDVIVALAPSLEETYQAHVRSTYNN